MTLRLQHNCNRAGCFNLTRRPKIEVFNDCFPRGGGFGDVDGLIELSGAFCLLEWKGKGGTVHAAQWRAFKAFTRFPANIVFVGYGDAQTMALQKYQIVWRGEIQAPVVAMLDDLKERIARWAAWVEGSERGKQCAV